MDLELLYENVLDYKPLNGIWSPSGSETEPQEGDNEYYFDVKNDDCGGGYYKFKDKSRCYKISISNSSERTSFSFYRKGDTADVNGGFGVDVFQTILKVYGDYITKFKPKELMWSPVSRTTGGKNREARRNVYNGWAVRHLFPDKYVGLSETQWIRRDIYDNEYASVGYPKIPDSITQDSSPKEKNELIEKLKREYEENRARIYELQRQHRARIYELQRQQDEERQRQRLERERQEREERERIFQIALQDPEKNPEHIAVNDVVYIVDPNVNNYYEREYETKTAIVTRIQFSRNSIDSENESLWADIKLNNDDPNDYSYATEIKLTRLKKETEEGAAHRERLRKERMEAYLNDSSLNPNGIREGDDVVSDIRDYPESPQNGLQGKIRKIFYKNGLYALIDWNQAALEYWSLLGYSNTREAKIEASNLHKATPEKINEIKRRKRENEIEKEIAKNSRRGNRQQSEIETTSEEIINSPSNPLHLKAGDHIVYNPGWGSTRSGYIISIEKHYYDDGLSAYIKFHGSNARPTRVWNINQLTRDESAESRLILARNTARQARQQNLANNKGGHELGDRVTVVSGINRGKSGRIVNFHTSGSVVSAIIARHEGPNIKVRVSMLQPPANTPAPTAENFSFFDYLRYVESQIK